MLEHFTKSETFNPLLACVAPTGRRQHVIGAAGIVTNGLRRPWAKKNALPASDNFSSNAGSAKGMLKCSGRDLIGEAHRRGD